jgi:hypothetical protein
MRAIFGLATLAFIGVIVADIAAHPEALKAGLGGLNAILTSTFTGMLGTVPSGTGGYTKVG